MVLMVEIWGGVNTRTSVTSLTGSQGMRGSRFSRALRPGDHRCLTVKPIEKKLNCGGRVLF